MGRNLPSLVRLLLTAYCVLAATAKAVDELEGERAATIAPNTKFDGLTTSSGIVWEVELDLVANYHYRGMISEPRQEFRTKSLAASSSSKWIRPVLWRPDPCSRERR